MQKNTAKQTPAQPIVKRSVFTLAPTELKAVVGGGGVVVHGPQKP